MAVALSIATVCASSTLLAHPPPSVADIGESVPGAERLEGRLLAPCCWAQTLDIHGSEISTELRREIRTRLKTGESPESIEQSLVARYGERMRAVPDRVPLNAMGTMGWLAVAGSAGFLVFILRQWRRRGRLASAPGAPSANGHVGVAEASDERLEAELRRFGDA